MTQFELCDIYGPRNRFLLKKIIQLQFCTVSKHLKCIEFKFTIIKLLIFILSFKDKKLKYSKS